VAEAAWERKAKDEINLEFPKPTVAKATVGFSFSVNETTKQNVITK
jgi:hypothetical protein